MIKRMDTLGRILTPYAMIYYEILDIESCDFYIISVAFSYMNMKIMEIEQC